MAWTVNQSTHYPFPEDRLFSCVPRSPPGDLTIVRLNKSLVFVEPNAAAVRPASGEIVLTTSLCWASDIFAICSKRTKNTTTRSARTYRWIPISRTAQSVGQTLAVPVLGGLHYLVRA